MTDAADQSPSTTAVVSWPSSTQTAVARQVPAWVMEFISEWQAHLLLHAWQLRANIDEDLDAEPGQKTMATARAYPDIMEAYIDISPDISPEPTTTWQKVLLHELLHVVTARPFDFVERDLLPELGEQARRLAAKTMVREVEPVIEALTYIIWEMYED